MGAINRSSSNMEMSVSIEWIVDYLAICWLPTFEVLHSKLINSFTSQRINCMLDSSCISFVLSNKNGSRFYCSSQQDKLIASLEVFPSRS